jgi:hypothetical protein
LVISVVDVVETKEWQEAFSKFKDEITDPLSHIKADEIMSDEEEKLFFSLYSELRSCYCQKKTCWCNFRV